MIPIHKQIIVISVIYQTNVIGEDNKPKQRNMKRNYTIFKHKEKRGHAMSLKPSFTLTSNEISVFADIFKMW